MKTLTLAALVFSLVGCVEKVTEVTFLDKVMTASDFTAQAQLRERVLAFCANDPGRLRNDPNCINAAQSVKLTSAGTGNFPRVKPSIPAWASKEAKAKAE